MKILVLNASPKGKNSATVHTALYLQALHPEHQFTVLPVGQRIRAYEKDFAPVRTELKQAELILFCYPVYTFIAPYQMHRFIDLVYDNDVNVKDKWATQITTSKHFYDITAHRFMNENMLDFGLKVLPGLSQDMEDLLKEIGRKELLDWMKMTEFRIEMGIFKARKERAIEAQRKYELRLYRFRKWVYQKKFFYKQTGKSPTTAYYILDRKFSEPYFYENFETSMTEGKDYEYTDDGLIAVKKGSLDRVFDKLTEDFRTKVLTNQEFIDKINGERFRLLWDEKCQGSIPKWEMDSLGFYYTGHELEGIDRKKYTIVNFDKVPSQPIVVSEYMYKGQSKSRFRLMRIAGTVIDKDKNKNTVTLLTLDGVTVVKFYKGQFNFYDRQISEVNEDGTKTVIEKSWFTRGTKLMVTGYRREDQFIPKKYSDSIYKHTVQIIEEVLEDGGLLLKSDRAGQENEEVLMRQI